MIKIYTRNIFSSLSTTILYLIVSFVISRSIDLFVISFLIMTSFLLTSTFVRKDLFPYSFLMISLVAIYLLWDRPDLLSTNFFIIFVIYMIYLIIDYIRVRSFERSIVRYKDVILPIVITIFIPVYVISFVNIINFLYGYSREEVFVVSILISLLIYYLLTLLIKKDLYFLTDIYKILAIDVDTFSIRMIYLSKILLIIIFFWTLYIGEHMLSLTILLSEITIRVIERKISKEIYKTLINIITPLLTLMIIMIRGALI
jgi:hypothetical protein